MEEEGFVEAAVVRLHDRVFKVPGVSKAVAFSFTSNKASVELGFDAGIAKGVFVEGNCLFTVDIFRPASNEVAEPVISGVQAVDGRAAGGCP